MVAALDSSFPSIFGGDWNFIERRKDKQGGTQFAHKEEDSWTEAIDMEWGVEDPWILKPRSVTKGSPEFTWQNKREKQPVWQRLDRFYIPVQWMSRVRRMTIQTGAFRSDHFPLTMDLALWQVDLREHRSSAMRFFRINMDVAKSETGMAGVKDILQKWGEDQHEYSPLKRLEMVLIECRSFLRELGKDFAKQQRVKEASLRKTLERLLLQIPSADEEMLKSLQVQINKTSRQISNLEEAAVKGHRIRAGLKWELEGDRPSAFFFQKVQEKRAKRTIESLLDENGNDQHGQDGIKRVVEEAYTRVFASDGPSGDWEALWSQYGPLLNGVGLGTREL